MVNTNFIHDIISTISDFINLYKVELLMLGLMAAVIVFVVQQKLNMDEVLTKWVKK